MESPISKTEGAVVSETSDIGGPSTRPTPPPLPGTRRLPATGGGSLPRFLRSTSRRTQGQVRPAKVLEWDVRHCITVGKVSTVVTPSFGFAERSYTVSPPNSGQTSLKCRVKRVTCSTKGVVD